VKINSGIVARPPISKLCSDDSPPRNFSYFFKVPHRGKISRTTTTVIATGSPVVEFTSLVNRLERNRLWSTIQEGAEHFCNFEGMWITVQGQLNKGRTHPPIDIGVVGTNRVMV
jgi:hypothetical protein